MKVLRWGTKAKKNDATWIGIFVARFKTGQINQGRVLIRPRPRVYYIDNKYPSISLNFYFITFTSMNESTKRIINVVINQLINSPSGILNIKYTGSVKKINDDPIIRSAK